MASLPVNQARASNGTARRRREQQQRAVSRHVTWLTGLLQSRGHHTLAEVSPLQTLASEVSALNSRVAELEASRPRPSGGQANLADAREDPAKQADQPTANKVEAEQANPGDAKEVRVGALLYQPGVDGTHRQGLATGSLVLEATTQAEVPAKKAKVAEQTSRPEQHGRGLSDQGGTN